MAVIAFPESSGQLAFIHFDATIREAQSRSAAITEHPLESGSFGVDHVRIQPTTLLLEVHVSDTPVFWPPLSVARFRESDPEVTGSDILPDVNGGRRALDMAQAIQDVTGERPEKDVPDAYVLQFDSPLGRFEAVLQELIRLQRTGTICQVFTTLVDYPSMLIKQVDTERRSSHGIIQIALTEGRIVTSDTAAAPEPAQVRGQRPAGRGGQATDQVQDTEDRSLAYQFGESLVNALDP